MKLILEDMTERGLAKLKRLLADPVNSHIEVSHLEAHGKQNCRITLEMPDSLAVIAGDIVLVLVAHCSKIKFE